MRHGGSYWISAWSGYFVVGYLIVGVVPASAIDGPQETPFFALAAEAQQAGEEPLADWLREWLIVDRPDQPMLSIPSQEYSRPASKDPLLGERIWAAATSARREHAKSLVASALQAAKSKQGWRAYQLLWQAHRWDPSDQAICKSLAIDQILRPPSLQRSSKSFTEIGWQAKSFQEVSSLHFRVMTRGDVEAAKRLTVDLERGLAVWRQAFVPLWTSSQSLADAFDRKRSPLAPAGPPMRVVLLADRNEYLKLLVPMVPGIEQSTGYYSPALNATFLYLGKDADEATRYHELTHQFLQEASRFRDSRGAGKNDGFWIVEGIACYAESLCWHGTFASLGGWESPRLQIARFRWLGQGHRRDLQGMAAVSQSQVGSVKDLASWYTDANAFAHLFLDDGDDTHRQLLFDHIEAVYRRGGDPRWKAGGVTTDALVNFLQVSDEQLAFLEPRSRQRGSEWIDAKIAELCLGGTRVTATGLIRLPRFTSLTWLDLANVPATDAIVEHLLGLGKQAQRLNFERTSVTDALATTLIKQVGLRELDLSSTRCGDGLLQSLPNYKDLTTLWLTGSQVSDASIDLVARLPSLQRVDLQLTKVTNTGLSRLKQSRPDLEINPLQVQRALVPK